MNIVRRMNVLKKYQSEIKFILVGGSSTLIDFIIYMILSKYINISLAKIISMSIASIYSFIINKNWTFTNNEKIDMVMIVKYIVTQILNITVNTCVNSLIFKISNIKVLAFVIATGVAMCVNFILQKVVVFKKEERKK